MFDKMAVLIENYVENMYIFVKKCHICLTLSNFMRYTFFKSKGYIMIDIYDSETIIKTYRLLNKKCEAIDKFIENHAFYFGCTSEEYGTADVCNSILDLIERKNQLINFKLIVDNSLNHLDDEDKKILFVKMNYDISMAEICGVLELKERTAFRRIERAILNLTNKLNASKYAYKLEHILNNEEWLSNIKNITKKRRMSYKI